MSQVVRLSSKLSKDPETNGLDDHAVSLAQDPHQVLCAITWLTVQKVTTDVETGEAVPTIMIRRIEPIALVDAVPAEVVELALKLYTERTGKQSPLPFGVTEVIEGGYVNPTRDDDEPAF
jgi:hypothetical protein